MPAKKFIRLVAGALTEVVGVVTSAGAANDGDVPVLDASGRIDNSMMPVGIGADTSAIITSEALAAGDFVHIHNATGAKARKADATIAGKHAMGFVLSGAALGASATVYFEGTNTQVVGQTPGDVFLLTTAGTVGATPPIAAGNIVQNVGVAISATAISFEPQRPVTLA